MAIIGPSNVVLKLDSNPIKAEVLSHFGHPTVRVELDDPSLEHILRTAGDFMAGYFPFEEQIAVFYTQPLVTEYPLPEDAYWIKQVKWDPAVTRIGDIFGAESFLFCFADGFKILRDDNILIDIKDWNEKKFKCKTPYGNKKVILNRHEVDQELIKLSYENGYVICTPNHPIKINNIDKLEDWVSAKDCEIGLKLISNGKIVELIKIENVDKGYTTTIYVPGAHCFYGCHEGDPILVH